MLRGSELIRGVLSGYRIKPKEEAGVFPLLTPKKMCPAFYALDDIRCLHILDRGINDNPTQDPSHLLAPLAM